MDILSNLFIVVVIVVWLALVYWTYSDAKRRIADRFLVGCATAGALFPFVGSLVYLIIRPPEFLEDARERELEIAAAEATIAAAGGKCPHCDAAVDKDFVRCPSCLRKLRESCGSCNRALDEEWRICPYCETEVPGRSGPAPSTAQRKRAPSGPAKRQAPAGAAKRKAGSAPSKRQTPAGGAARKASSARSADTAPVRETSAADDAAGESASTD